VSRGRSVASASRRHADSHWKRSAACREPPRPRLPEVRRLGLDPRGSAAGSKGVREAPHGVLVGDRQLLRIRPGQAGRAGHDRTDRPAARAPVRVGLLLGLRDRSLLALSSRPAAAPPEEAPAGGEPQRYFVGQAPDRTGQMHLLVLREAPIRIWIGNDFSTLEHRGRHFFEVVTDRSILSRLRERLHAESG